MTLKYENTIDHIRVFSQYLYSTSPTIRRSRRMTQLIVLPLYLLFGALYYFGAPLSSILKWLLVTTAFLVFISYTHKRSFLKNQTKLYKETENKNLFSVHTLSITDGGLSVQDESQDSNIRWNGIERIAEYEDFTFVFLGSADALMIPKSNLLEGDYTAFTEELKNRFNRVQSQVESS